MNVEQIIINPITTPDYPDPTEVRHFIDDPDGFYGYDYVFLEDATWNALCEIARERGCTVDELCGDIDLNFAPSESFAPSACCYVLRYIDQVPENIDNSLRVAVTQWDGNASTLLMKRQCRYRPRGLSANQVKIMLLIGLTRRRPPT